MLVILRGPAASGKSTYTEQLREGNDNLVVVNRDSLRFALFGKYWGVDEELVSKVEKRAVRDALLADKIVVSDNTNLTPRFVNALVDIAYQLDKPVVLIDDFKDVPLDECLVRNAARERKVPEKVLTEQWMRAQRQYTLPPRPPEVTVYEPDESLSPAVLVDLDGTAAIHNGRSPYDEDKCDTDLPNAAVRDTVRGLFNEGYTITYVSARQEKSREKTTQWLRDHDFAPGLLYMRQTGDQRKDWIVKNEIFDNIISKLWNVKFCLDDRDQVVDMYRRKGLSVFQVNDGNF